MDFFKRLSGLPLLFRFRWVFVALIFIWLGYTIYIPSLLGPFQFDDFEIIVNGVSPQVNIGQLLLSGGRRSIGMFSFQINYLLWGQDPFWYHVVNVFIHICVSLLVTRFCYLLFQAENIKKHSVPAVSIVASLVAGLFFLVHPVQTQAVSYIVQRFASLATLFYLSSLLMFLEGRTRLVHKSYQKAALFFILSAFFGVLAWHTKESSYSLVGALALLEVSFFQKHISWRQSIKKVGLLAVLLCSTLFFARGLLKDFLFVEVTTLTGVKLTWYEYFFTQFSVIVKYLRLIVLPANQNLEHYAPLAHSFFEPTTMVSGSILIWFCGVVFFLWSRFRLTAFGMIFFFLTLSVESSIFPLPDLMYEHRLYLPMIGVAVIFASGVYYLQRFFSARALYLVLASLLLTLSFLTYQRNFVWSSHTALWQDVVAKNPFDLRGYYNLSTAYEEIQRYDLSIPVTEQLVLKSLGDSGKDTDTFLNNLSVLYRKEGKLHEAQAYALKAYSFNPHNAYIWSNIATIERELFLSGSVAGYCGTMLW